MLVMSAGDDVDSKAVESLSMAGSGGGGGVGEEILGIADRVSGVEVILSVLSVGNQESMRLKLNDVAELMLVWLVCRVVDSGDTYLLDPNIY